ncbi:MAG: TetR family transcriptional regulator [Pseudomonadales bacterium]|nr:TetR/AcrR family transcriptional regulator [Pseudomonadales bacterium]NIX07749.1 TetR family transcriptional regulator [Pseudomonadales bacterium]
MKGFTERQLKRRERILAAARQLITDRGYDGVTMRDLAKESGVAPKTLYHQFHSKENLLRAAVEERYRYLYQIIDDEPIEHGIDRLFFIIDTVARTTENNLAYAKALRPLLTSQSSSTFAAIRMSTYRKAIDQIEAEGEIVDWVDVDILAAVVYRQVNPIYLAPWYEETPWATVARIAKLDISLILAAVTSGYTRKAANASIRELQKQLKRSGSRYI